MFASMLLVRARRALCVASAALLVLWPATASAALDTTATTNDLSVNTPTAWGYLAVGGDRAPRPITNRDVDGNRETDTLWVWQGGLDADRPRVGQQQRRDGEGEHAEPGERQQHDAAQPLEDGVRPTVARYRPGDVGRVLERLADAERAIERDH